MSLELVTVQPMDPSTRSGLQVHDHYSVNIPSLV